MAVVTPVVEEDEEVPAPIALHQPLEELLEVRAALALGQEDRRLARLAVERTEDGDPPVLPRGRDDRLPSDGSPDPAQAGIEMEFAFVDVDEGGSIGLPSPFLSARSRAWRARRTWRRSCLCFKLSLGRL